ncbi:hypothetical protein R3P38DRAFT_2544710, partial [Favolaschia claudopus]
VCFQWRSVALLSPSLWRAFSLYTRASLSLNSQILNCWLQRSGCLRLSIGIYLPTDGPWIKEALTSFITTLVAHSARWEHISLTLPFECMNLLRGQTPFLRSLMLGPCDAPMPGPDHPISLFSDAPQLHSVRLSVCFEPDIIALPWANLSHLEATLLSPQECATILSEAKNLSCFRAVIVDCDDLLLAIPSFPKLQSLTLIGNAEETPREDLLDALTLPMLRQLNLHGIW